jgi:hypothetical protein
MGQQHRGIGAVLGVIVGAGAGLSGKLLPPGQPRPATGEDGRTRSPGERECRPLVQVSLDSQDA